MHGCVATMRWANPVEPRSKNKKALQGGVWVVHRSTVLVVVVIVVVAAAVAVVVVVASGVFAVPSSRHSLLLWGGGWGGVGGNNDKPNHIPQKALRPHNPKPEAVQSQSSSSSPSQTRSNATPNIPNGLRLPARSSAIPNMPSSSQSQTLNLNKTGSPKQCNPEPSSSRRPAEAVQCETSNSRRPAARNSSSPRLQPERAYKKYTTV